MNDEFEECPLCNRNNSTQLCGNDHRYETNKEDIFWFRPLYFVEHHVYIYDEGQYYIKREKKQTAEGERFVSVMYSRMTPKKYPAWTIRICQGCNMRLAHLNNLIRCFLLQDKPIKGSFSKIKTPYIYGAKGISTTWKMTKRDKLELLNLILPLKIKRPSKKRRKKKEKPQLLKIMYALHNHPAPWIQEVLAP